METVADFKRRLTPGTKLIYIYHQLVSGYDENRQPIYKNSDPEEREVVSLSSSGILTTRKPDGNQSRADIPTKDMLRIEGDIVSFLGPDYRRADPKKNTYEQEGNLPKIPVFSYRFLS